MLDWHTCQICYALEIKLLLLLLLFLQVSIILEELRGKLETRKTIKADIAACVFI